MTQTAVETSRLDFGDETAEDVADGWAEQGEDHDNDHRDEHEDEGVLHEALAFVVFESKHGRRSFLNKWVNQIEELVNRLSNDRIPEFFEKI